MTRSPSYSDSGTNSSGSENVNKEDGIRIDSSERRKHDEKQSRMKESNSKDRSDHLDRREFDQERGDQGRRRDRMDERNQSHSNIKYSTDDDNRGRNRTFSDRSHRTYNKRRRGSNFVRDNMSDDRREQFDYNRGHSGNRSKRQSMERSEEDHLGSKRSRKNDDSEHKVPDKETRLRQSGDDNILTRTGGAYIPPARLKLMQAQIKDKSSDKYQRIAWEALKKSIHGLVNKVNVTNMEIIARELIQENLIRGRGLFARIVMQAQAFSPNFSNVYACLVSIINTKFPLTGEIILKRLIIQFRRGFRRNDKQSCMTSTRFIAHLINQQFAHEVIGLELLTLLLENPTDDAVEVAIGFMKECGAKLTELTPKGVHAIFERLRSILHEGQLDKRVQYMIEVMFAVRKDGFKDFPSIVKDLDLMDEKEQFTHLLSLDEAVDPEDMLNVFKLDPDYEENEERYKSIKKEILSEGSDSDDGETDDSDENSNENDVEEGAEGDQVIFDNTETNLISLRRTIYLTIQSSLDFEECAHKLLKLEFLPEQTPELCHMVLDCCAQQRTYEKFYGLLGQRFCQISKIYVEPFQEIFCTSYDTIHRFETNKLRNVAKFFAHLLYTDAISWLVLSRIHLNEEETTSSSRIFIKILFQELCEYMGLPKLNERVKDVTLQDAFDGLFPRDHPKNTRFAINFFTSIGLGGLTDDLREHLKIMPKANPLPGVATVAPAQTEVVAVESSEEANDDSDDSSDSEEEKKKKKKKDKKKKKKKKGKHENKENQLDKKKKVMPIEDERQKKKKRRKDKPREELTSSSDDDAEQMRSRIAQPDSSQDFQKRTRRPPQKEYSDNSSSDSSSSSVRMQRDHRNIGGRSDYQQESQSSRNLRINSESDEEIIPVRRTSNVSHHNKSMRRNVSPSVRPKRHNLSRDERYDSSPDSSNRQRQEASFQNKSRYSTTLEHRFKGDERESRMRLDESPEVRLRRDQMPDKRSGYDSSSRNRMRQEESHERRSRRQASPPMAYKSHDIPVNKFRHDSSPVKNYRRHKSSDMRYH